LKGRRLQVSLSNVKPDRPRSQRLLRLHLRNWRNFVEVDIPLRGRAFFYGPNASGKSNLLDAVRFLHDLVDIGGGFAEAITKRGGVSKLRSLAARRYPDVEIEVGVSAGSSNQWTYRLAFNQDNRQRPVIKHELVRWNDRPILTRPDDQDRADQARLQQTYIEQVNVNREFRDLATFFQTVRYLHLVPQLVRDVTRYVGRAGDPFGSDFLEQIARTPERARAGRLRRIGAALKVAVPQLKDLEFFRDDANGTPHLRGRYEHWRPNGAWQTEDQFSDGTLRLLGLLWSVLDGTGPLLLEEPELSLHPDVVRYLPQLFANLQRRTGRQVLVSSHSDDLISDDGIGLDEVFILRPVREGTRVEAGNGLDQASALLEGGASLSEVVRPETRPPRPQRLAFVFG
jgi:AAA domain, putative AbiEii toxin, Type IV TA system